MKRLSLPKTIVIPKGIVLEEGPTRTTYHEPHYQYTISVGNDHFATLIISEDAIRALKNFEPQVTVL